MEFARLSLTRDGHVLLDGKEINRCTGLVVKIDPAKAMEVELHVAVDEVAIEYANARQMESHS